MRKLIAETIIPRNPLLQNYPMYGPLSLSLSVIKNYSDGNHQFSKEVGIGFEAIGEDEEGQLVCQHRLVSANFAE